MLRIKKDKTRNPFGDIKESSGEERGSFFCLSPMVGWFKPIVNHLAFVKCEVFMIYCNESSQLLSRV